MNTNRFLANRATLFAASVAVLSVAGLTACSGADTAPESLEGSDQSVEAGKKVSRSGVVTIKTFKGSCTGVLLNRFTVLTAAHCIVDRWDQYGETFELGASAVYKDPSGNLICLTEGDVVPATPNTDPPLGPKCADSTWFDTSIVPGFDHDDGSPDPTKDLAVLRSRRAFAGVGPSDYALLVSDPIESPGSLDDGKELQFYGYGYRSVDFKGFGSLRVGTAKVVHADHQMLVLDGWPDNPCHGDSGGPVSLPSSESGGNLLVAGLISGTYGASGPSCHDSSFAATSVSDKIDFIQEKSGAVCNRFTHPKTNREVARCFDGTVTIQAEVNGNLVQTRDDGLLVASAEDVGSWSKFELISHTTNGAQNGLFSLISMRNHRLVMAEDAGASPLVARATEVGDWEKFRFNGLGFVANVNGKFVTAENGGSAPLIARADAHGSWETFKFKFVN